MVYFKENYIFSRFQRGSNICPSPPLDLRMQCLDRLDAVTKVRYEKKLSSSNLPGYPVEIGHEIFSTVILIPSYSKKCSCRYWQNLTLRHFVDLTIKQLVDGSI